MTSSCAQSGWSCVLVTFVVAAQLVGKSAAYSLRYFCCDQVLALKLGFLVSSLVFTSCRSALFPAVVALLTSCRFAIFPSPHCQLSRTCPCFTAGSRCDCSSRLTSRNVACSSSSLRALVFRRAVHPSTCWPTCSSRGPLASSPAFTCCA